MILSGPGRTVKAAGQDTQMVTSNLKDNTAKAAKTQGQDGKVPTAAELAAQDQAAVLAAINGPSKLAATLLPLGVDSLSLIDAARDELAAKLQDQIKQLAGTLLASFRDPVFTVSSSPAANVAAVRTQGSSLPSFFKIDGSGLKIKEGKPEIMPVRDLVIGMGLMAALTDNGCYLVIKGGEKIQPISPDLLAQAAQAARLLNPSLLPDLGDSAAYTRAERLVSLAESLGVPIPAETVAQAAEREANEKAEAEKAAQDGQDGQGQ